MECVSVLGIEFVFGIGFVLETRFVLRAGFILKTTLILKLRSHFRCTQDFKCRVNVVSTAEDAEVREHGFPVPRDRDNMINLKLVS